VLLQTSGKDRQNLAMNFDSNFWIRQDFSVAVPDAFVDLVFPCDDIVGAAVVVVLVLVQGWREGELPDSEDVDERKIEGALVHVAGAVEIPKVVKSRCFSH
jgi:hypothetical protein